MDGGRSGDGVAVVGRHQPPLLVHQHKLVEGVAHIALIDGAHPVLAVGNGHIRLPDAEDKVGLVVQPVPGGGVHGVAGMDIEHSVVFGAAEGAGVDGLVGVGPLQAGLAQPLPVLGVLHHPDDLLAVRLGGVVLAEDQKVIALAGKKSAEQGQLHGNGGGGEQLEILVIGLHHHRAVHRLHPGKASVLPLIEVGLHGVGAVKVVGVVPQIVRGRGLGVGVLLNGGLLGPRQLGNGLCVAVPAAAAGVGALALPLRGGRLGNGRGVLVPQLGGGVQDLLLPTHGAGTDALPLLGAAGLHRLIGPAVAGLGQSPHHLFGAADLAGADVFPLLGAGGGNRIIAPAVAGLGQSLDNFPLPAYGADTRLLPGLGAGGRRGLIAPLVLGALRLLSLAGARLLRDGKFVQRLFILVAAGGTGVNLLPLLLGCGGDGLGQLVLVSLGRVGAKHLPLTAERAGSGVLSLPGTGGLSGLITPGVGTGLRTALSPAVGVSAPCFALARLLSRSLPVGVLFSTAGADAIYIVVAQRRLIEGVPFRISRHQIAHSTGLTHPEAPAVFGAGGFLYLFHHTPAAAFRTWNIFRLCRPHGQAEHSSA